MRLFALFIIALLLASCNPCKRLASKCPPSIVTKIRDRVVYKDTVVYRDRIIRDTIPGDTVEIERLIPIDSKLDVAPIKADSKYAEATAWVDNSVLRLRLRQKDQVITHILESAEKEVTHWKEAYHNKEVTETIHIKERYVPKIYRVALFISFCAIIVVALVIYTKIKGKSFKWL